MVINLRTPGSVEHQALPGVEETMLERVALTLNSTLELWEVLRALAGATLDLTAADRCSVFLLEGRTLQPVAAIGRVRNEDLWAAFQEMGAVELDSIPGGWELLLSGNAVAFVDAPTSNLIPSGWVKRFDLKTVVIVPLLFAGEPCGLMAVDYQRRRAVPTAESRVLEAIGAYAGVAVRNARLYEATRKRSELQEGLARAAAVLVSPLDRRELSRLLVDAYCDLFAARTCAIGILNADRTGIETVASRGMRRFSRPVSVASIPSHIVERLEQCWDSDLPLRFNDDPWFADFLGGRRAGVTHYALFPLCVKGNLQGGVLLGFPPAVHVDPEEASAGEALAAIASAALERSILLERLERQLRYMETLHDLSRSISLGGEPSLLLPRVREVLGARGFEIVDVTFRDRKMARAFGSLGGQSSGVDFSPGAESEQGSDSLTVPMSVDRRVVGDMTFEPSVADLEVRSFLETVGNTIAEVALRILLRDDITQAERERAVAAERDRIAADLHDTAGQLFIAITLLARRQAEEVAPESRWRDKLLRFATLSDQGKWEIDQAIRALSFFPAAREGLAPSLRSLARSFEADSGIQVHVEVPANRVNLSPRSQRAFYRVAHEALANAWRHARCENVFIHLSYERKDVVLQITDDGIGINLRGLTSCGRNGIANMRRAIQEIDGDFSLGNIRPHGMRLTARSRRTLR